MPRKIHVGNGPVYLIPSILTDPAAGWVNIDLAGPRQHLASSRPDLVAALSTHDEEYYARFATESADTLRPGPKNRDGVSDAFGSFGSLPCGTGDASQILARHVFEHLSLPEARRALAECDRALAPGGLLRLDVPDHEGTVEALVGTKDLFFARHLFGSRKDDYGYHVMSYTRAGLAKLCGEYGFVLEEEERNPHFYPAFTLRFRKPDYDVPRWQYAFAAAGVEVNPDWVCADVGCGAHPWPRARYVIDSNPECEQYRAPQQEWRRATVCEHLPFGQREIDFVTCFHVMEHVSDPVSAAKELTRVAKRGFIECPHPMKDAIFNFHEIDHEWWVWPPLKPGGALRFQRIPKDWVAKLRDPDIMAIQHRLMRLGGDPERSKDSAALRRWWARTEPIWNVYYYWEDECSVEVIE